MASQGGRPPTSSSDSDGQRTIPGIHRDEDAFTLYLRRQGNMGTSAADIQLQFQANPSVQEEREGGPLDAEDREESGPPSSLEANPTSSPIVPTSPVNARVNGQLRVQNAGEGVAHIGAAFDQAEQVDDNRQNGLQTRAQSRNAPQVNGARDVPTTESSNSRSEQERDGRHNGDER